MLTCPTAGITSFQLVRAPGEETVEVILGESSYVHELDSLKLWLHKIGLHWEVYERLVDLSWNWPLVSFDVTTGKISIPEVQRNPLDMRGESSGPFRAPRRQHSAARDPFDPLQDRPWSTQ